MSELEKAINELRTELEQLGHGGKSPPPPCTRRWYRARALALGLSLLRKIQTEGFGGNEVDSHDLYVALRKQLKLPAEEESPT